MKHALPYYMCIMSVLLPVLVMAQDDTDMDELVVTATRTPHTLKNVPVQTRLITNDEIRKSDATNIMDLLEYVLPGIEFSYAMNQQVNMNLAGFMGQSVLILIDGQRLAGETMDNVDFERISMMDVERVEIIRGSASALYGSNAAGGVINIITKKAVAPWSVRVDSRWANHGSQRYDALASFNKGRVGNTFGFAYTSLDSYDVKGTGTEPQTTTFNRVYGGHTLNFKDKIALKPCKNFALEGRLGYFYRKVERSAEVPERYRDYSAGLSAKWDITPRDRVEASYAFDQYDKSDFYRITNLDIRRYSNVQNSGKVLYSHVFGSPDYASSADKHNATLTLGADYLYDFMLNRNVGDGKFRQQSFDVFAQYDWVVSRKWEIVAALRYDNFIDKSGGTAIVSQRVTPRLAARFSPTEHCRLRASYGMGFRAPTLKERYYDFDMSGIWTIEGNPDLRAESSHNVNLSTEYFNGGYSVMLSGSYTHANGRISTGVPYQKEDGEYYLPYINLDPMDIFNVETTLQGRWSGGWSAKLSYNLTLESSAPTSATPYMPARPHSLTAHGGWEHRFCRNFKLDVQLSGRFLSAVKNNEFLSLSTPDAGVRTITYPAYTLWKLQATGHIASWARVTFTIDNIFNYRPEYYYLNAPLTTGTSFMGGLSVDVDKIIVKRER